MPQFSEASKKELATCDERLQRLFNEVIKHLDVTIVQGKRTEQQEAVALANGKSRTKHSKHVYPIGSPSLALDFAPFPIDWSNRVKSIGRFYHAVGYIQAIAEHLGIPIRCGADWDGDGDFYDQSFDDLGHIELVG